MSLNFAILGAGRIGRVHAKAVAAAAGANLTVVFDLVESAAYALAAEYGCDVRGIDEIAVSDDVDAVIICTPTDAHADMIEQFARVGKAVFCEKPLDLNLTRAKATVQFIDEIGATLMVGFQRRFDPDFQALKAAIDNGEIGKVEMIALTSRDPEAPPIEYIQRSGGIFRDMTIHDFDVARWILGEEVDRVTAAASNLVDPAIGDAEDYDSVNVLLTSVTGKQCTITNTRRAVYGYDQRIEVLGSKGMVTAENTHKSRVTVASSTGFLQPPLLDFFMMRYAKAYTAEIEHFVAAVTNGSAPATSGIDGLMALALAEAARLSVLEDRVVRVEELLR